MCSSGSAYLRWTSTAPTRKPLLWAVAAAAFLAAGPSPTAASALCGDGVVDAGEECDLGGSCIGGPAAGSACHVGNSTCTGGTCVTFGGKGCAANCTTEHDVRVTFVPGHMTYGVCGDAPCDGLDPGTSGIVTSSDFLSIPLPFGTTCNGGTNASLPCATAADCPGGTCLQSSYVWTVGKEKDGRIPVVIKAGSVQFPAIPVGATLACGCVRGVGAKTCGGTIFEPDGVSLSPDCTPGFSSGDPCAGKAPCAFVYGEGNTAAGVVGCDGLDGTDLSYQICGGVEAGASPNAQCQPEVHLDGHGGPGAAIIFQTLGITSALGTCSGSDPSIYGPDGVYCTADDPPGGIIAMANMLPLVTGSATLVAPNYDGSYGVNSITVTGAPFQL